MAARGPQSGVTIEQIVTDFGISEAMPQNWLRGPISRKATGPAKLLSRAL